MQKTAELLRKQIVAIFLAVVFGILVTAVILAAAGYSPAESFAALFRGIYSRPKYISNTIIKSTPIILTGLSVAFAFKTGLFNMGAEGQYIMGTIAATMAGLFLDLPPVLEIPVILLAGMAAGAVYGGIVGVLKAKFGIHEVITSIMLNWIALYLNNFIVNLPAVHKPNSSGTYVINESGYTIFFNSWKTTDAGRAFLEEHPFLGEMLLKTDLNAGILFAVAAVLIVVYILKKTSKGYQMRAVGLNRDAAESAGIPVNKTLIQSMLIAGAISGLAGALVITGMSPHKISTLAAFENNGWNGVSVALIAGNSPVGCLFAGLLFGGFLYGGQTLQSEVGAPSEIINIMLGTIVFFVALSRIAVILAEKIEKRGRKHAE